jgi:opacity protein-like surface antigen
MRTGRCIGAFCIVPKITQANTIFSALQSGFGWFRSTDTIQGVDAEVRAVPITLTAKGLYPIGNFEPYAEAGFGYYFCHVELASSGIKFSDDDRVFGWHLGLGATYNINKNFFVGIEGRYLWAKPSFQIAGTKGDVTFDGLTITGNFGFRF